MQTVFPAVQAPILPVAGDTAGFPVRRIFCIGRNYADHAKEMGAAAEPIFFMKPGECAVTGPDLPFPAETEDLHHEVEMVLALGPGGDVWGAGVGVDLTRRDRQGEMKERRGPWEIGKAFPASAPLGPLKRGPAPNAGAIRLAVNGETRQSGDLSQMILDAPALISALSRYFDPGAGDLIFTGTPAGVGPIRRGDKVSARIAGLPDLDFTFR